MQWVVAKHIKNCCNVRVIFRTQRRLRNCFTFKDTIPESLRSYIVYRYKCNSCNEIYIGKTDRHYYVRNCEHFGITPIKGKVSKRKLQPSKIRDHLLETHHDSCMETDFSILDSVRSTNDFHLRIKESLYIHRDKPVINGQESSTPLELFIWVLVLVVTDLLSIYIYLSCIYILGLLYTYTCDHGLMYSSKA